MKSFSTSHRPTVAVLAATMLAFGAVHAADKKTPPPKPAARGKAAAPAPAPVVPPEEIKSVFEEPRVDPFFPKSLRFTVVTTPGPSTTPIVVPVDQIVVRGILLGKEKTAIINGKSLGEGESAAIKLAKTTVNVRVIEIRERSVVVRIDPDPEPKEIYLRATP